MLSPANHPADAAPTQIRRLERMVARGNVAAKAALAEVLAGKKTAYKAMRDHGLRPPAARRPRYSELGVPQPTMIKGTSRVARTFRRLSDDLARDVGRTLTLIEREQIAQAVHLLLRSRAESDPSTAIRLASESRRLFQSLKGKSVKNNPAHPSPADFLAVEDAFAVEEACAE